MNEAGRRRFPPVSGPFGWAGVALVAAAFASELVAGILLVWTVLNRDGRLLVPLIICFFLTFPLIAAATGLWWLGMKRSGTLRPSTISKERQRQMFGTLAVMNLGSLLGLGSFIYLALRPEGPRRFAFAMVPILLASLFSYFGVLKLRQIQNRPAPQLLGLSTKQQTLIVVVLVLSGSALMLITGLFLIPN